MNNTMAVGAAHRLYAYVAAVALPAMIYGCQQVGPLPAAPIGDREALERLASNYETLSDRLITAPMNLPGGKRKIFVEEVFEKSGYSYAATLRSMVEQGDLTQQYVVDLAQLLLLPHQNSKVALELSDIYPESELQDIKKLQQSLRKSPSP